MTRFARVLGRIAIIAAAAAVFAGLTFIYARSVTPPTSQRSEQGDRRERGKGGEPRQRPATPQLAEFPAFIGECGLFAVITVAGRKVLRLRL